MGVATAEQLSAATEWARFLFAGSDEDKGLCPINSKKDRQVRLQIWLSEATLEAIDDYLFTTRKRNRSEALRQLLKAGRAA
jgi:hypothetical protein